MKIGVTGHRPQNLIGGWAAYGNNGIGLHGFVPFLRSYLLALGVTEVVSGMAVGFDTIAALAAYETSIKLAAFIPFEGHHKAWRKAEQETFQMLMLNASTVSKPDKVPYNYQEICISLNQRNKDIVDSGIELLVALCNKPSGGTANCIRYAKKKQVPVYNIWDDYNLIMTRQLLCND